MTTRSWTRKLFAPTPRTVRKAAARCRPTLETLESRWLPSNIVVNSVLDNVNDAVITGPTVTLREAYNYARGTGDTVTFDPSVAGKTITLTLGALEILPVGQGIPIIDGGTAGITISGNHASRVFQVDHGGIAILNGLTIIDGVGTSSVTGVGAIGGGGILNLGSLVLTNCTLADNSGDYGGGIYNVGGPSIYGALGVGDGWLSLTNCTLSGNSATRQIYDTFGNPIDGAGVGGGICNLGGSVTLTACTLSGNSTNYLGGNIANLDRLTDTGSLVGGTLTLTDCVVAQGLTPPKYFLSPYRNGPDLANQAPGGAAPGDPGSTISGSNNLIGDASNISEPGVSVTDSVSGEPLLGPLGYYGGPTPTVPLLPGSLGIGSGIAASYFNPLVGTLGVGMTIPITTDQRGFALPASGQDLGAFQTQSTAVDYLVTTTADPGVFGQQSLRGAVDLANLLGGSPTITFGPAVAGKTITLTHGQLELTANSGTIPMGGITISGDNASRVFQVDSGATAIFNALTITAGQADSGGGILNQGTLTLTNCTLAGNSASSGGGISSSGTLTLTACTLARNSAQAGSGGGILNQGTLTLTDTIVAQSTQGGDIKNNGGSVSGSYDLIGDGSAVDSLTNSHSGQPVLGPLGYYGGPTQTVPLLPGSLGIAVGTAANYPGTNTPITADQRGQLLDSAGPDIGAFQTHGYSFSAAAGSGQEAFPGAAFANPLRVTVSANNNLDPVVGGVVTFAGPTGGASLAQTVTAAIGNGGQASATVTANGTGGAYTVFATATGISTPATFTLTNVAITFGSPLLIYNGSPQSVSSTVTPTGATYSVQYYQGATPLIGAPTNAGNYTLVIGLPDGEQASQSFTIARTNPTIVLTAYAVTYDGQVHTATGTVTGAGGQTLSGLVLGGTAHTNAGDYPSDAWTFTDTTGNYYNASGTVHDSIARANATIVLTAYAVAYDGQAHTATGSATGALGESLAGLNLSATSHTSAGSYTDSWTFTDQTGNYNNATGTVSDSIARATPTVQVTAAGGTYNGSPFAATATVAGLNGVPGTSLEGVAPTLTYYAGSTASGTPLAGAPVLPGTYTAKAAFAGSPDYAAASATTTFRITTPTTSILGPTLGVPGQPLTDTFAVNGPTQGVAFNVNYGDGTSLTTTAGGPSRKLDHLYTATGTFTLQVTATDANGVVSQLATQAVTISTVALEADPGGGTALAVGGNAAGGDTITVSATNTSGKAVDVTVNKTDFGTFTPTGHIFVYGQGGKDSITLKAYTVGNTNYYIQVPAFLYGEGPGGDKLSAQGSAANNVLTGHGSNEVLTGGQGRDLLIGGTGAATLNAGAGDDLLIGGWTNYDLSSSGLTYDQKLAALYAILAEWGSTDSYGTRLAALAGYLNTSTVHDNSVNGVAVVDQLNGNRHANDWFFAGLNDQVTGTNSSDVITLIT
jgi:hypothetical protein